MKPRWALLAACCVVLLAGCPQEPLEVPSLLDPVLQDEEAFRPHKDSALLSVRPGTPIDSLEKRLVGCWGIVLDEEGQALIALIWAFRFDADGTYEGWGLQRDAFGLAPVLVGETGSYTIVDAGRIRITREQRWSQAPGEAPREDPDAPSLELGAFVTVSGDAMLLVRGPDDPDAVAPEDRIYYLYRRFECPRLRGAAADERIHVALNASDAARQVAIPLPSDTARSWTHLFGGAGTVRAESSLQPQAATGLRLHIPPVAGVVLQAER